MILLVTEPWTRENSLPRLPLSSIRRILRYTCSSHETFSRRIVHLDALLKSYVQLFWIYFPAPVTEAHKAQISKLKGIREPARGING
ncbi:hypothetical protein N7449_010629 [Penicillium cf. viridicatum]|uniref:Uncharacterized protein n=1 Tax=Penicillium cf. viridicatum TaxID=2972119 RepID=A0A9W9J3K2_9EURO|nr:hypothetical protein N7449_010629 [Penicillium cf. viridicatum]